MTIDDVRRAAQDAGRASQWDDLYSLIPQLRADEEWPIYWVALAGLAARLTGRPDEGVALLREAVSLGFSEPDLLEPEITNAFGTDPDWPDLRAAMLANVSPPPARLLTWPTARTLPYQLFRLSPESEAALRDRIPSPTASAWETATTLTAWVTRRWWHSSEHTTSDALHILDQVDAGARFACLEYATVLAQAFNALGVPSRRVALRLDRGHARNPAAGHVVAEAWIDDLGHWVEFDGQHGLYWTDGHGTPLGVAELHRMWLHGEAATPVFLGVELPAYQLPIWFDYFAHAEPTGVAWGHVPYSDGHATAAGMLVAEPVDAYPDFGALATYSVGSGDKPALRFVPSHPFAVGVRVGGADLGLDDAWELPLDQAGEHEVSVATRTAYGVLRASTLRYTVSG